MSDAKPARPFYRRPLIWIGALVLFCGLCFVVALLQGNQDEPDAVEEVAVQPTHTAAAATNTPLPTDTPAPTGTPEPPTATAMPTDVPPPTATPEPMQRVEGAVRDALGRANRDVERVASVELIADVILVEWAINENLTEGMTLAGAREDVRDIMQAVAENGGDVPYNSLSLIGTYSLVDQLGNVEESPVVEVFYERPIIEQIQWPTFLTDNVYEVAESVTIHPAFQE